MDEPAILGSLRDQLAIDEVGEIGAWAATDHRWQQRQVGRVGVRVAVVEPLAAGGPALRDARPIASRSVAWKGRIRTIAAVRRIAPEAEETNQRVVELVPSPAGRQRDLG